MYFTETRGLGVKSFLIAEPEKALVDYLYFVSLGKRAGNDRIFYTEGTLNKEKVRAYARLYERKKLNELLQDYL